MTMFERANASYRAKNSTTTSASASTGTSNSGSHASLAKQLFPSSSPTPLHDTKIKDHFQRRTFSSTGFARSGYSHSYGYSQSSSPSVPPPVRPRTSDAPQPLPSASRPANEQPMASLYRDSEASFKHEPSFIDLTGEDKQSRPEFKSLGVEFDEGDFSDDDKVLEELKQESFSTLPPQPPRPMPKTASEALPTDDNISVASWPESSPSHLQAAQPRLPDFPVRSEISEPLNKRPASESDSIAARSVAKKRKLPESLLLLENGYGNTRATPAAKAKSRKDPSAWEMTPGAVKDQQKKLKNKGKTSTHYDLDEMQQAMSSHVVRQSALTLSNEQELVKELVCDKRKSVFFTGPAGTGKSVLMRAIIEQLRRKYANDSERLAVTASTGLAACNIGGMTLHSFAGIGLGKDDVATLVKKIRRNPKVKNRWLRTKVLVIDEISMVDGELFDKLSQIGRTIRNNGRPWGGIQLVITGDFFQLPPVPDRDSRDVRFAFEAGTWTTSIDHTIGLSEVFRQKDPVFAGMLNEMRLGRISDETVRAFKAMARPLSTADGMEVTELFPTRHEVENSNGKRLRELPGEIHRYDAIDTGDPTIRDKLLGNMMAPKTIELKKGAQVMLIKNMDETLVNGSLGTVIGFSTESMFEITEGIVSNGDNHGDDGIDPKIKQRLAAFSRSLDKSAGPDQKLWPVVLFHGVDGTQRTLLCVAEPWKVETPTGEVQASREQLPLILAWALSIHKAQGQTLLRVKVDLGKVFEKGQAYVALSRAVTQQGLQVLRFDKQKVMAHPRVISFYEKLYSAETALKPSKKAANASITNYTTATTALPKLPAKKPFAMSSMTDEEEAMASYAYA